ncbi:uncharacterized protein LOC135471741 [Liolophura sinensis]|uniref:uncharacterized protein LOC135471741 n=1 Tax=Liolophura sinensis TaxID=3198878 RepID=UPI0031593AE6
MGCQESKTVRVQPFSPGNTRDTRNHSGKIDLTKSGEDGDLFVTDKSMILQKRKRKSKSGRSLGSRDGLDPTLEGSDRGGSASSKGSHDSQDSGLGLAEDYSFVITENSHPDAVREVENSFQERDLELSVVGVACPRRQSARAKRHEELVIIQALREEGLISLPKSSAAGGLSFEVVMDKPEDATRRPPARLAKLEKRKKKKKVLTEEQIKEKLERAERRRKEREQSKLEKIREWESKHENMTAAEGPQAKKEMLESQVHQKMDQVTDKREKRLQEVQEKMRKKAEHAERVRQRKLAAALAAKGSAETGEGFDNDNVVQVEPVSQPSL